MNNFIYKIKDNCEIHITEENEALGEPVRSDYINTLNLKLIKDNKNIMDMEIIKLSIFLDMLDEEYTRDVFVKDILNELYITSPSSEVCEIFNKNIKSNNNTNLCYVADWEYYYLLYSINVYNPFNIDQNIFILLEFFINQILLIDYCQYSKFTTYLDMIEEDIDLSNYFYAIESIYKKLIYLKVHDCYTGDQKLLSILNKDIEGKISEKYRKKYEKI